MFSIPINVFFISTFLKLAFKAQVRVLALKYDVDL